MKDYLLLCVGMALSSNLPLGKHNDYHSAEHGVNLEHSGYHKFEEQFLIIWDIFESDIIGSESIDLSERTGFREN